MLHIFEVTLPFFALVLAGFLAVRQRWLPLDAITGLNSFVLFFALPAMLYRFGSTTPIARLLDASVFSVYLVCALVMVGLAMVLSLNERIRWNDAAFGALVATYPNNGFMGVPLLAALLGPQSVGTVIVAVMVDMVFTSSLCIALSRLAMGERGAWGAMRQVLRGVLANPLPWAMLLGALASATGLRLPQPVEQTVGMLADAASPVALFTIGAVLARAQLQSGHPLPARDYLPLVAMKLLLHPLLLWGAGRLAQHAGLPLSSETLLALVLIGALPSASNVAIQAERYGADTGRVARIILVSTALAFLTFSGAVAVLRG
ncbi:MAG TPA: AEC family transporter [Macromonas sp.]|nr:AEC family transporter [Macromonas sp.]